MIPLSYADGQVLARLDAVGSDGYDLGTDRIPAFNGAQQLLTATLNAGFDTRKPTGEGLRDLNKTAVFQTSEFGQIAIDQLLDRGSQKLWTVIGVHPEFQAAIDPQLVIDLIPTNSLLRTDIRFVKAIKSAKRITQEEVGMADKDVFSAGNSMIDETSPDYQYAYYLSGTAFTSVGQNVGTTLSVIRHNPGTRKLVGVSYLKVPEMVPNMVDELDPLYATTQLEWPDSISELLINLVLKLLAIKTGDNTTQYTLTQNEVGQLLQAIM